MLLYKNVVLKMVKQQKGDGVTDEFYLYAGIKVWTIIAETYSNFLKTQ